jgi:glutaredoxin
MPSDMAEIKLFTKNNCGKCDYVKERLPEGLKIQIINVETVDGLAEGAFYEVLDKGFPVLVVDDVRVAEDATPVLKKLKELAGQ